MSIPTCTRGPSSSAQGDQGGEVRGDVRTERVRVGRHADPAVAAAVDPEDPRRCRHGAGLPPARGGMAAWTERLHLT